MTQQDSFFAVSDNQDLAISIFIIYPFEALMNLNLRFRTPTCRDIFLLSISTICLT